MSTPPPTDTGRQNLWAETFLEYRERLLNLARRNLNPILLRRVSAEDAVQDALSAACGKIDFFENHPEVPVYCKLRTILLQTITALERKHLQSQKRDAYKELEVVDEDNASTLRLNWNLFADSITGPLTRIARVDRYELLRQALAAMPENDRQILELRHFDGMSNQDCAEVLKIAPKAASIRYVRALERLQKQLIEFTEFRP